MKRLFISENKRDKKSGPVAAMNTVDLFISNTNASRYESRLVLELIHI